MDSMTTKTVPLTVTVTVGGQPAVGYYVTTWGTTGARRAWFEVGQGITDASGVTTLPAPDLNGQQQGRLTVGAVDQPAIYAGPLTDTVTA